MTGDGDSRSDAPRPEREAEASRAARQRTPNATRARPRGGADIERACALRDMERGGDNSEPAERLAEIDRRIEQLEDEHRSLIAEREWLNRSLLEFDDQAAANGRFLT